MKTFYEMEFPINISIQIKYSHIEKFQLNFVDKKHIGYLLFKLSHKFVSRTLLVNSHRTLIYFKQNKFDF